MTPEEALVLLNRHAENVVVIATECVWRGAPLRDLAVMVFHSSCLNYADSRLISGDTFPRGELGADGFMLGTSVTSLKVAVPQAALVIDRVPPNHIPLALCANLNGDPTSVYIVPFLLSLPLAPRPRRSVDLKVP